MYRSIYARKLFHLMVEAAGILETGSYPRLTSRKNHCHPGFAGLGEKRPSRDNPEPNSVQPG